MDFWETLIRNPPSDEMESPPLQIDCYLLSCRQRWEAGLQWSVRPGMALSSDIHRA